MLSEKDGLPVLTFTDQAEFVEWLAVNAETRGLWIRIAKKDSGVPSITRAEALAAALRYGWIDGQARPEDDRFYRQRFTPRTRRSRWSRINRTAVERMIEAGEMTPRGLREVDAAKADGRWEAAYASPATATVPADLQAALDANPAAAEFFATLTGQNRYSILFRVEEAKRPETRARRIATFVAMLERGETVH